jgi:hypothetical protein
MDQTRENTLHGHNRPRNPGAPLSPDWFESAGVNTSAVERRAPTLTTRRSVKREYPTAWLVAAEGVADALYAKLRARMAKFRVGDSLDKSTDVGAIVAPASSSASSG